MANKNYKINLKDKVSLNEFLDLLNHPRCIAIRVDKDILLYPKLIDFKHNSDPFLRLAYSTPSSDPYELTFVADDNLEIPYENGIFRLQDEDGETYEVELLSNLLEHENREAL